MKWGASICTYWAMLYIGKIHIHWHFPWGWKYNWKEFLWAYSPYDSDSWFMRVVGIDINWMY